ncbi:hypothetical protein [Corynebacterium cystitidis]|uniref:Secreted protein n=1 Tax=Corynebacterium cystitidis DSM 20524 TaxID=1121357 RepID=A0A1H9SU71_9CORY|nr:hypothetical protein [Corynebacterium cystitidis]WJY83170.1 hypothetical protein CCYS_11380 [Corynebacterium cystitidis DSM 20524]SER87943.1 hypothetical protein SAMN05661109_01254 [Corynebacterium cystitidis DSM 20524]SNV67052.1 Uncharacterised protein [Corynebacterium cystitidis]
MHKITRITLATTTAAAMAFSGTTVASADNRPNPFGSSVTTTEYKTDKDDKPILDDKGNRIPIRKGEQTHQAPQSIADAWGSMQQLGESSSKGSSKSDADAASSQDSSSQVPAWVIPVVGVLSAVGLLVAVLNYLVPAWSINLIPLA